MVFGKIVVKNNYEKKGDLVYRPLFRLYEKLGIKVNDEITLLGLIVDSQFYELSSLEKIDGVNYKIINQEEFNQILEKIPLDKLKLIKDIIVSQNKEVSSMEDLSQDRYIEFSAYNNDLSYINPYSEPLNGYNDFIYKCKMLKR